VRARFFLSQKKAYSTRIRKACNFASGARLTDVIRPFHISDLGSLYRICLLTGADGEDASGTISNEILGHFFAAPYAVTEPELCWVLTHKGDPVGYVLGTADSVKFSEATEADWWPHLRERYPMPDARDSSREAMMIRAIHRGYQAPEVASNYPAHLHIDLLPIGQGRGLGKSMIEAFLNSLRHRGVAGLHLGVSKANQRAMDWYPKLGFRLIEEAENGVTFGMKL
jgi:ribosomal protein S18 acetylase RimI-like enzyme